MTAFGFRVPFDRHDKQRTKPLKWWRTKAGLPAFLLSHQRGHWLGYVIIGRSHPLWNCDYLGQKIIEGFEVHGGVTFAGQRLGRNRRCWMFGFDADHGFDLPDPRLVERLEQQQQRKFLLLPTYRCGYATVKDEAFMVQECEKLAAQLAEVKRKRIKSRK